MIGRTNATGKIAKTTGILITSAPTKTSYLAGSTLELEGISVAALLSNGSLVDVTDDCSFSPADGDVLSVLDDVVVVTYGTFLATQSIEVHSQYEPVVHNLTLDHGAYGVRGEDFNSLAYFAGGHGNNSSTFYHDVICVNSNLTKSNLTPISSIYWSYNLLSASLPNHLLYFGHWEDYGSNIVCVYGSDMVAQADLTLPASIRLGPASSVLGDSVIIGGCTENTWLTPAVYVINDDLTIETLDSFTVPKKYLSAASTRDKVVFLGGQASDTSPLYEVYDDMYTHSTGTIPVGPVGKHRLFGIQALSFKDRAFFAGGTQSASHLGPWTSSTVEDNDCSSEVCYFNNSLTLHEASDGITHPRAVLSIGSLGDNLFLPGGYFYNGDTTTSFYLDVDVYDEDLVKGQVFYLDKETCGFAVANLGDRLLLAGGRTVKDDGTGITVTSKIRIYEEYEGD